MSWPEIDFRNEVWTIPAERMKGHRAHVVPLAPEALALLKALPRYDLIVTSRDSSVLAARAAGARNVLRVTLAADEIVHRSIT